MDRLKVPASLLILILGGCTSMVSVELPLPERPVLPKILGIELQCLTQDVYDRLRKRDILKDIHRDKLEAVIKATL